MRDSIIVSERTYHGHLDMACELLADKYAALKGENSRLGYDVVRWRTLALAAISQYADLLAAHEDLLRNYELVLDEYYHLRRATTGNLREEHDSLCRRHRASQAEIQELYVLRDELRELRSQLAQRAA